MTRKQRSSPESIVRELEGFVDARRSAGGDPCPPARAVLELDINLYDRVAAGASAPASPADLDALKPCRNGGVPKLK